MPKSVVYGVYENRTQVAAAVDALRKDAYRSQDITVLFPEGVGTEEFAQIHKTNDPANPQTELTSGEPLGWLTGVGTLLPGIGPFIAAMSWGMLVGGGATREYDSPRGAMIGMGISEEEVQQYEQFLHQGGVLLAVHCEDLDWANRAVEMIKRTGARQIGVSGAAKAKAVTV